MKNLVKYLCPIFVGILFVSLCAAAESVSKDLMATNVERTIDISSQLVKINTKLTLSNEGQSTLKFFHFAIEDGAFDKVSYIGATVSEKVLFHCVQCIKKAFQIMKYLFQ